jgi:hypothetical protein
MHGIGLRLSTQYCHYCKIEMLRREVWQVFIESDLYRASRGRDMMNARHSTSDVVGEGVVTSEFPNKAKQLQQWGILITFRFLGPFCCLLLFSAGSVYEVKTMQEFRL